MSDTAKPAKGRAKAEGSNKGSADEKKAAKSAASKRRSAPDGAPNSPEPAPTSPSATATLANLSADQRQALESLSINLARAAMTAQSAVAEAALRQADRPAALSPDPFHVGAAMSEVIGRLAAQPDRLLRAQADEAGEDPPDAGH